MKKAYRVKKSQEIEQILKEKKYRSSTAFSIYQKKQTETIHFRQAIRGGKKLGNAVERNRLKRQIRAIVRELKIIDSVDLFIIVRKGVIGLSYETMKQEIVMLLKKQKLIVKGANDDAIHL